MFINVRNLTDDFNRKITIKKREKKRIIYENECNKTQHIKITIFF